MLPVLGVEAFDIAPFNHVADEARSLATVAKREAAWTVTLARLRQEPLAVNEPLLLARRLTVPSWVKP